MEASVGDGGRRRRFRPTARSLARGVGFGLWVLFTSGLGVVFFHFVPYLFVILFINPPLYRKLADEMIGSWLVYCVALLELVLGIKVVTTGDKVQPNERNVIMMNHRTRLDWMYFWSVLVRQSGVKTEKIILKAPLKKIPGAGWAMQVGAFIFLDRVWEKDKAYLATMLNYFSDLNHQTQVLLFPEGTDFCRRAKARSDEFAKKNDWPPYEFCLHPRTTGFTYITQLMRENDHLDAVYDVTVGYPYNFPHSEPELVAGNVPKEVHFHLKRYAIEDLPNDEDGLQKWCQKRWEEKEARLKKFYAEKSFSDTEPNSIGAGEHEVKGQRDPINPEFMLRIALVYWTVFVIGISVILWYSALARLLSVAQVVFYLYMGHRHGGFELFQADYYNWFFRSKKTQESLKIESNDAT